MLFQILEGFWFGFLFLVGVGREGIVKRHLNLYGNAKDH